MRDVVARISVDQWEEQMGSISEAEKKRARYLRSIAGGVPYIQSHKEYACKGDRLLDRLKFDSGKASLKLWSFLFSEKDRLFYAKENGWKIFATMKDLGQVPIITYAAKKSLTFYADEIWWAPCFAEDPSLLDTASKLGATDELCYVRAALGAYKELNYFPKPHISFAGVGSCCDDFSAVMQLIEWQGFDIHWWEIPARFDKKKELLSTCFKESSFGNSPYQEKALSFLVKQYEGIVKKVEEITGEKLTKEALQKSVQGFNRVRSRVQKLRLLVYGAKRPPLPGLEMLLIEFIAIHYCSEPEEAINVLDDLIAMVEKRLELGESPFDKEPLRVYWVTPPTDAALITLLEDLGGSICGSEYLISHAFIPLDEGKEPLQAIAENYMDDPMIGSSAFRAKRIVEECKKFGAEGVIISGIFGASHCPFEDGVISRKVGEELDIPVLSFDVPYSPGRLSEQVVTRMESFVEILRINRGE